MRDRVREVTEDLDAVFRMDEGPINTGTVLTTPSTVAREVAVHAAKNCPIEDVLRDMGALAARALANELMAANLRPADYAMHHGIAPILHDRLVKALLKDPQTFAASVAQHLQMLG